jgi:hypothetical protein
MECDMRQWLYETDYVQNFLFTNRTVTAAFTSEYIMAGCPWKCNPPADYWETLLDDANRADVIVFNLGSHYEFQMPMNWDWEIANGTLANDDIQSVFRVEILQRFYDILHAFLMGNDKVLLVRGPSPSHFDTENGLANETQRQQLLETFQRNSSYGYCAPLQRIPAVVQGQKQILRQLVDRLQSSNQTSMSSSVAYIDVYELSKERYYEHTTIPITPLDCKHFCQSCGLLRGWNALVIDYLMSTYDFEQR